MKQPEVKLAQETPTEEYLGPSQRLGRWLYKFLHPQGAIDIIKGREGARLDKAKAISESMKRGSATMNMLWLEGFAKAAADRGLSQAETTQLLKVSQRLHLMKQNPDKYAEGYKLAMEKSAALPEGLGGYLTAPFVAPLRASEMHAALKGKGETEENQPFSIRHPYLTPLLGNLGGQLAGALAGGLGGASLGKSWGDKSPYGLGAAGAGIQLGSLAGGSLGLLATQGWQQHRVNQILERLAAEDPELYARLKEKKAQVDQASVGTSNVPAYPMPVTPRAAKLYRNEAADIKAKPSLNPEDIEKLEYLTNRALGRNPYVGAAGTQAGNFLYKHRLPVGVGLGVGAVGLGALLVRHLRQKREKEEAKAKMLRSPARA